MKNVLILHGWGNGSKGYVALAEKLRERGCTVYLFDLPGFGEAPPPPTPWSVDDYVDFVKQKCDQEGLSRFFLLGHSFGGRIGIRFAVRYPNYISGLILYAAAGIKPRPSIKNKIFLIAAKSGSWIFDVSAMKNLQSFAKKILYRLAGSRDYLAATGVMKETIKKVLAEDLTPSLGLINRPTLLIWGGKDKATPVRDAYTMHDTIKGSELKIVPEATHISLHKEEPERLADLIFPFIEHY